MDYRREKEKKLQAVVSRLSRNYYWFYGGYRKNANTVGNENPTDPYDYEN